MFNFNLADKFVSRRHYLVVDRQDVTTLLEIINGQNKWYINTKLNVGNCAWTDQPSKWFIHFNCSDEQWMPMIEEFGKKGYKLYIKDRPKYIYVSKKLES